MSAYDPRASFNRILAETKGEPVVEQPREIEPIASETALSDDPERVLSMISELSSLIEQSTDIGTSINLRDRAQALEFLTRKVELESDIRNRATIAVINAKRKIGELTMALPQNDPFSHNEKKGKTATLEEFGLDHNEVYRNETLAKLDIKRLNLFIDKKLSQGYEITVGAAMKYAENVAKHTPGKKTPVVVPPVQGEPDPEVPSERITTFEIPDEISWMDEYYDFARNILPDDVKAGEKWEITARRQE